MHQEINKFNQTLVNLKILQNPTKEKQKELFLTDTVNKKKKYPLWYTTTRLYGQTLKT